MQTKSLLFAVTVFAFAGCQDDLTEEKGRFETSSKDWAAKIEKIKKGHTELVAKAKDFVVPAGEAELAAAKAAVDASVKTGTEALTDAEHHLAEAKTVLDGAIAKGKKIPVELALSAQRAEVDGSIAKAQSQVDAANEALELLSKKIQLVKATGEATRSRIAAWAGEVKKKGGLVAIDDLVFNADAIDAEKSRVALISLVATLKSCAELKVDLTVTALGEAADLGTKRAEALKTYLTVNGVDGAVFAKVVGSAVKEGEEKVAVAVSTPCK